MPRFLDTVTGKFVWKVDAVGVIYAILSHTWRSEDEGGEQSYDDVRKLQAEVDANNGDFAFPSTTTTPLCDPASAMAASIFSHPKLSDKIKGICEVARKDGYRLLWNDACCIDKSSSSELSEAINSMYEWYRLADVCYVYLSDVSDDDRLDLPKSTFRQSVWHTRGWTLQELIAPSRVVFLTNTWSFLGTKVGLAPILEDITGVDFNILTGRATLGSIAVARRMSWAARRETTRVEDQAYSLMGIFEVHMPTIYGEGHNAFLRLQEEIMRTIPDQSIFAWGRECTLSSLTSRERSSAEDCSYSFGLLAHSPRDFDHSGGVKSERKSRFVSASRLSPAEFASCIGRREEDVPSLHSVFTPQGVQMELLCIELKHIPQILLSFFPSLEAAGSPAWARCMWLGSPHALALLQCEDKDGALVTLPLYRPPFGAGDLQGLRIGTQIEGCDWHTPFHTIRLTKGALTEALQYLSPIPTKVSLLRYFPPARPTISALPHRTSLFSSMDGEDSVNFCIAPSCEEELRALGFSLSPLQSSHSRADNEYYILATSLDSSPGSPFSLSIRLKIVLAKRKMSPSSSLGSSLRGLAPSADAEAHFSAASADCRITSDAGTTRNISRSPPLSSSLINIETSAHDGTNGSHMSLSFYSDAFGTQDAPLAADFIIHPGAAVENMHLLDPPGLLRIALRHPPNISEVLPHRVLWLSVEISNTPQWARLSVRHPDKLLSATRTGVASRRIDVSEDRRTHREARPRSTSMSAADSGPSSTTDVLPPSRTVGGSQEFRTPLLGAGLIVGLIIVICRYFYS